jgi:hypothetical protein
MVIYREHFVYADMQNSALPLAFVSLVQRSQLLVQRSVE